MAKGLFVVNSFNAGEIGPLMANRADFAKYSAAQRRMRNFIPLPQGPATKRVGTRFVGEIKSSASRSWLIPFIASQNDAFILEFGDSTVRFYTNRGQVLETALSVTAMTNAALGVFTHVAHGLSVNDEVYIATLPGTSGIAGRNFKVNTAPSADTFTLKDLYGTTLNTTASGTYSGGGTVARVYTLASPYSAADITASDGSCDISFTQSSDVVYLCVPGYAPRKLTRTAAANWAFATLDQTGGPFESVDPDQTITVYSGASTGTGQTLTASSAIFTANHVGALFLLEMKLADANGAWEAGKAVTLNQIVRSQGHYYKCTDAGTTGTITPSHTEGSRFDGVDVSATAQWEYQHSGYGWAKITAIGGGGTTATVDILSTIPDQAVGSGNASTRWAFGEWSTANGFPTHVTFFRERLAFARGTKIWFSVPQDFESFLERDAGVRAPDSSFFVDVRSGVNDQITWMMPSSDLLVGTEGGEFSVRELSTSEVFGPGNAGALAGPGYGARKVAPVKVNDAAFYAQISGRKMRELRFAFETDGYVSLDRTILAHHIANGQIVQLAFAKEPYSIIWSACHNGDLLGFTYDREQDVQAWHKHPVGGSGIVESVAVIPSPDGTHDDLWLSVRRTINGVTKRYAEYVGAQWDEDLHDAEDMNFTDSSLAYDGAATTTITGLYHLEGATVKVLADAIYAGTKTVTNGGFTLTTTAAVVQAGLSYTATLQSMSFGNPALLKRIVRGFARMLSSLGLKFGPAENDTRSIVFRDGVTGIGQAVPPYTGTKYLEWKGGNEREAFWTIEHDEPTACTVLGLAGEIETSTQR